MRKRDPARLYPKYENITIENFLLENRLLVILIIITVLISIFIIGCLLAIPYFQAEHVYNTGIGSV